MHIVTSLLTRRSSPSLVRLPVEFLIPGFRQSLGFDEYYAPNSSIAERQVQDYLSVVERGYSQVKAPGCIQIPGQLLVDLPEYTQRLLLVKFYLSYAKYLGTFRARVLDDKIVGLYYRLAETIARGVPRFVASNDIGMQTNNSKILQALVGDAYGVVRMFKPSKGLIDITKDNYGISFDFSYDETRSVFCCKAIVRAFVDWTRCTGAEKSEIQSNFKARGVKLDNDGYLNFMFDIDPLLSNMESLIAKEISESVINLSASQITCLVENSDVGNSLFYSRPEPSILVDRTDMKDCVLISHKSFLGDKVEGTNFYKLRETAAKYKYSNLGKEYRNTTGVYDTPINMALGYVPINPQRNSVLRRMGLLVDWNRDPIPVKGFCDETVCFISVNDLSRRIKFSLISGDVITIDKIADDDLSFRNVFVGDIRIGEDD